MTRRTSLILARGVTAAAGPILTFSVYLLFAGHNQPGGGFAGGLVAAVLVALVWSSGGLAAVERIIGFPSSMLMGLGITLAGLTGFVPMLFGGGFLESGFIEVEIPLIGKVKAVSALVFDIGVYLTVVGMALQLIRSLGEAESELFENPDETRR